LIWFEHTYKGRHQTGLSFRPLLIVGERNGVQCSAVHAVGDGMGKGKGRVVCLILNFFFFFFLLLILGLGLDWDGYLGSRRREGNLGRGT
jgi:hypothetical protein